jgi:hypothetical protein
MRNAGIIMAVVSFLIFAIFGIFLNIICCNVPVALILGAIAGNMAATREGSATSSSAVSDGVKAGLITGIGAAAGTLVTSFIAGGAIGLGSAADTSSASPALSGFTGLFSILCLGVITAGINFCLATAGGALGGWFKARNQSSAGWMPQPAGPVINVAVARPPAAVPPQITAPATPDISGGKFTRHPDRGACGVCMKSLPPGEGYEIPADTFYGSKAYQDWLANSPLGQMVIPGAGGIDSYLEKARSRRGNSPVLACAECLHLFMATPTAVAAPPKPENPPVRAETRRATPVLHPADAKPAARKPVPPSPEPGPDLSGGRYHRLEEGGVCDVCAAAMEPGEGYRIPVDVFYTSEKYRRWLMESPLGQMAIPMAGGIDAYIQSARAQDPTAWSGVCGHCVELFQ